MRHRYQVGLRPLPIGNAMEAAADLMARYFLSLARRTYGEAAEPQERRNANTLARWVLKAQPEVITVSRIRDKLALDGLGTTADVKAALAYLVGSNWLATPDREGRTGRPPLVWVVNQSVFKTRH